MPVATMIHKVILGLFTDDCLLCTIFLIMYSVLLIEFELLSYGLV